MYPNYPCKVCAAGFDVTLVSDTKKLEKRTQLHRFRSYVDSTHKFKCPLALVNVANMDVMLTLKIVVLV